MGNRVHRDRFPTEEPVPLPRLRGQHSARRLQGPAIETFGDPGLLADVLWPELKKTAKRYRVGLVPHYEDRTHPKTQTLANGLDSCTIIDVFDDVTDVLRQIASCECILSSSLHGLIVADAFRVPNAWIRLSEKVRGDDFKFRGTEHSNATHVTGSIPGGESGSICSWKG